MPPYHVMYHLTVNVARHVHHALTVKLMAEFQRRARMDIEISFKEKNLIKTNFGLDVTEKGLKWKGKERRAGYMAWNKHQLDRNE